MNIADLMLEFPEMEFKESYGKLEATCSCSAFFGKKATHRRVFLFPELNDSVLHVIREDIARHFRNETEWAHEKENQS